MTEQTQTALNLPLNILEIREYLPHRYPFLLVDRITDVDLTEDAQRIEGFKNVSINEEFFQGHFPGYPIMPGVLIMEALAQLSGVLAMMILGKKPKDGLTFVFAGMESVRFKRQVLPGDQLVLKSELLTSRRGLYKFKTVACVDGNIVAQAELLLAQQDMAL